jgi:hypothetical protein
MIKLFHRLGTVLGPVAAALAASSDGPAWMRAAGAGLGALVALLAVLEKAWGRDGLPPLALLALLLLPLAACPRPVAVNGIPNGVISCGVESAKNCASDAFPAVANCLDGEGDVTSCILGLVQPAGCVTFGVVACLTRRERDDATTRMSFAPSRRLERANEFLAKTGAQFDDGR